MSKKAVFSLTALSLALGSAPVFAQSETAEGFIEGSTLSLINRNYYFNRDFRDGESATGNGYSEEWAHGLMAFFESGYTQGPASRYRHSQHQSGKNNRKQVKTV